MHVLTRIAALGVWLVAAGCDADLGPTPMWIPWEMIEGEFRPEVSQPASPPAQRHRLRVVTYNVLQGLDADVFAPYVLDDPDLSTADVLLLQEAEHHDDASDAARLASALGMGHIYVPTAGVDRGTRGLAIISRFPMRDIEVMYLQEVAEVEFEELGGRGAIAMTIDTPSGPVRFIDLHLDAPLNITDHILQLRPALVDAPAPIVIGGDFNTNDYVWVNGTIPLLTIDAAARTSQAPELDDYMRGLGYSTPTAKFGDTWSGFPEDQRLDAIFTRGLGIGEGKVDRVFDASDHWPLWLDVEVRVRP